MSYIAKRKNRIINISEEKTNEYAKMGYTVTKENGEIVSEPEATTLDGANIAIKKMREEVADKEAAIDTLKVENKALEAENKNLKEKLEEAAKYAEDADKKIEALEAENAELKSASTSGTKKSTKSASKSTAETE